MQENLNASNARIEKANRAFAKTSDVKEDIKRSGLGMVLVPQGLVPIFFLTVFNKYNPGDIEYLMSLVGVALSIAYGISYNFRPFVVRMLKWLAIGTLLLLSCLLFYDGFSSLSLCGNN